MTALPPGDLQRIYSERFRENTEYRAVVWRVLIEAWFQQWVRPTDTVLDLGAGYGEFINNVRCHKKYGMDLNPDTLKYSAPDVECLLQDCSVRWPLGDGSLDVVFTSNFFEHLPDKAALARTLAEAHRCLKPGGTFIAMGPNVRYLPGAYWDFWDHHIPLSDASLTEALKHQGFGISVCIPRFLPYTMANGRRYPARLLRWYLRMPVAWRIFGKQFLIVCRKP